MRLEKTRDQRLGENTAWLSQAKTARTPEAGNSRGGEFTEFTESLQRSPVLGPGFRMTHPV